MIFGRGRAKNLFLKGFDFHICQRIKFIFDLSDPGIRPYCKSFTSEGNHGT